MVLVSKDSGASSSFEFAGSNVRKYIFNWDKLFVAHTLRVPLSVWMANTREGIAEMPRDLQSQNSFYPLITQFYVDPAEIAAPDPRGNRGWRQIELEKQKATVPKKKVAKKVEVVEVESEVSLDKNEDAPVIEAEDPVAEKPTVEDSATDVLAPPKKKRGRPKKASLEAKG